MPSKIALIDHLQSGATTTCRAWKVVRKDGTTYGFTDHDLDLNFDGVLFKADSGLTAGALQLSTGLSVDNTEVIGALSDAGIKDADLAAGRFDGAEVTTWLMNWANVEERVIRFRGTFGEIQRVAGTFKVELRGMAEALNQERGRVYQPNCPAVLGDNECRFDLSQPGFTLEASVQEMRLQGQYVLKPQPGFADGWFERGTATVLDGRAIGLKALVKFDQEIGGERLLSLWVDFELSPQVGDTIKFEAGCNKLAGTCRNKFGNFLNFRGFPHIPSTDWVTSYPVASQRNDGGSRFK